MTDSEKPLSENDARRLAELAQIPEASIGQFCELLEWQILEAHLWNEWLPKPLKASDLKRSVGRVAKAAKALDEALGAFWIEGNAAALAGSLLESLMPQPAKELLPGSRWKGIEMGWHC